MLESPATNIYTKEDMNQINNLEKIVSFDKFGNLDQVYIVDTLDPKTIIEKQEYNYYKNIANETLVPFLNSRTLYSYNTDRSLNKILFTKEESIESYLLFIDAINLHENNTEIRFWKFQSSISKKAFIEKKVIIEKVYSIEKGDLYRVVVSYEYDSYYKGKKIHQKNKFIYDKKNPEHLKEIVEYKVTNQFFLINKLFVPILNFLICFLNMSFQLIRFEIPTINQLILLTKVKMRITTDLPNELIESSSPVSNAKQFSCLRDEFYIHGSIRKENIFYNIQKNLEKIVKENKVS